MVRKTFVHGNAQNPTLEAESDSLSSVSSLYSTAQSIATPAVNSSRKRLRYAGGTPPALPKKGKKMPKGRGVSTRNIVDTANLPMEGVVVSTSLHGAIPKILNSGLMTNKDAVFF